MIKHLRRHVILSWLRPCLNIRHSLRRIDPHSRDLYQWPNQAYLYHHKDRLQFSCKIRQNRSTYITGTIALIQLSSQAHWQPFNCHLKHDKLLTWSHAQTFIQLSSDARSYANWPPFNCHLTLDRSTYVITCTLAPIQLLLKGRYTQFTKKIKK